jgi:hypothetical protein
LENTASRVYERLNSCFAARDWAAITELLADDVSTDDRRRVVNSGRRRGRDAVIAEISAFAAIGVTTFTTDIIAIRGERLVLGHSRTSNGDQRPDAFHNEVLRIVEIDACDRIAAVLAFDLDDFDAAVEELDTRYLAGEAAPYSAVWSAVVHGYVALNRHELPLMTADAVSVDHRRGRGFTQGDLPAYLDASWELMPQSSLYIADVNRLNDIGAVVTHVVHGTTEEGFDAEWREITVLKAAGDRMSRSEMFDEEDFDAAIAKFDEFARPARRLENAASQASGRYLERVVARDWDAVAEMLAGGYYTDDRRHVVGGGIHNRDAEIVSVQAQADLGVTHAMPTVIALRGERLALSRVRYSGRNQEQQPFLAEMLIVFEINADDRFTAAVAFDLDDLDAAFTELDARYLAGEAAEYLRTWSVIAQTYAAFNRHELSPTTPDWVNIDHRRGIAFAPGDMTAYIRAGETLARGSRIYIETVHRLSHLGVVVTQVMKATSRDGFEAEWREVGILTVDGNLISRGELFDDADLDAALARFEELHPQGRRLENAASQVYDRLNAHFAARDWDSMTEIFGIRRDRGCGLRVRIDCDAGRAPRPESRPHLGARLPHWRVLHRSPSRHRNRRLQTDRRDPGLRCRRR